MGAQWLSGRVLDSRPSHRFEPHWCHCVVVLEQDIYLSLVLVQPMKARPYITERFLMGSKESNKKKMFLQVLTTLGQIHCILPFALKLYLTCHLLITFANGLDPDQAQHSVQA